MIDLSAIPAELQEGENWPLLNIDPEWLWLARDEGRVVGFLLAAPCHGMVLIWRIKMIPSAPVTGLARLLRAFLRDVRKRGYIGYMATIDITRQEEQVLARIAVRNKATFLPLSLSMIVGSTAITDHLAEGLCPQ